MIELPSSTDKTIDSIVTKSVILMDKSVDDSGGEGKTAGAFIIIILFIITFSLLFHHLCKNLKNGSDLKQTADSKTLVLSDETANLIDGITISEEDLLLEQLEDDPLGQGHFGAVYLGTLKQGETTRRVAIKLLKSSATDKFYFKSFLNEAAFTVDFSHPHILPVLGVCWRRKGFPLLVLPYMSNGSLLNLLRDPGWIFDAHALIVVAIQVASGMTFLSSNKLIHRDLAARNCLVDEHKRVIISDFGLSRDVYLTDYYRPQEKNGPRPVKWWAPESIAFGYYTSKSDMWSYGVLLWELFTRGGDPYADVPPYELKDYLTAGYRLNKPLYAPDMIYSTMQSCWQLDPDSRPSFGEIHNLLLNMLLQHGLSLDKTPISPYTYVTQESQTNQAFIANENMTEQARGGNPENNYYTRQKVFYDETFFENNYVTSPFVAEVTVHCEETHL